MRARLTLVYGGLFFAGGVVLLGVTYALLTQQLDHSGQKVISQTHATGSPPSTAPAGAGQGSPAPTAEPHDERTLVSAGGRTPPPGVTDLEKWMDAERNRLREAATSSLLTQGGLALLVVGGAAAGFGWLIAGRVLAPLHRVTDTAHRIASAPAADRGLHERIALRGPDDEVKDLADTFDTMVERLHRSFDGQRRFVANASHELRTPLTLGRALVEVAMHRATASEDVRQLGENLLEINTRHERLITGLLLLARSENEIAERLPVDLADVVTHVTGQIQGRRSAPESPSRRRPRRRPRSATHCSSNASSTTWSRTASGTTPGTGDGSGWSAVRATRAGWRWRSPTPVPPCRRTNCPPSSNPSAASASTVWSPRRARASACPSSAPSPAPTAVRSSRTRARAAG